MRRPIWLLVVLGAAPAPPLASGAFVPPPLAVRRSSSPRLSTPRVPLAPRAQQRGPLEEGFSELMPMATEEGNVSPELVERVNAEVMALTGVGLDDLLNPSKVVNYEREVILLTEQIAAASSTNEREELQKRLDKVSKQLYSEKRTVFAGWLKGLFIGQAVIAVVLGGVAAFDAFPWFTIDISLRALGFWSFWLFIIPSLRARRPKGWEKFALDIAFLGSPIVTIGAPFVTKDPALIWGANLVLLVGAYAAAFALRDADLGSNAGFSGALNALDFGTGQERGIRGEARERYFAQQKAAKEEGGEGEKQEGATEAQP